MSDVGEYSSPEIVLKCNEGLSRRLLAGDTEWSGGFSIPPSRIIGGEGSLSSIFFETSCSLESYLNSHLSRL